MNRVCKTCKIEKSINEYYSFTQKNGNTNHRRECKLCNKKSKQKNKNKGEKEKMDTTTIKEKETGLEFQDMDTILDKDLVIKIITSRDNRVRTTLNLNAEVKTKLDNYSKSSKFNTSDILSMILWKFFDEQNI
jgi:hypothetical protein